MSSSRGPSARTQQVIEYESETADTASERFLAFLALGRDLNALREQVKRLWKAYGNHEMSLSSVAIATNTAIALARAIEGVSHIFKPDGYVEGMLAKLLLMICTVNGMDTGTPSVNGSNPFDIRLYGRLTFA